MYIQPKAGRLATGAYSHKSPIAGSVFGSRPRDNAFFNPGGIDMPRDRTATDYSSPIADQHNTATIKPLPASTWKGNASFRQVSPFGKGTVQIGPYERGTFMRRVVTPVNKPVFGASPSVRMSDTAFHAVGKVTLPRPKPQSETNVAPLFLPAFRSHNNNWNDKNNSFYQKAPSVTNPDRIGRARWQTVKKGVV